MSITPKLSIIYVYYNTPDELKKSFNSLKNAAGEVSYEVIIIDNNSFRSIPSSVITSRKVTIVRNSSNRGYGSALNQGAKKSLGSTLLFVNPDTIFKTNSVKTLYNTLLKDKKIGICGPQLLSEDEMNTQNISAFPSFLNSLVVYSFLRFLPFFHRYYDQYHLMNLDRDVKQKVDVIGGACMMIKKSLFDKVGNFDERFFMYFEESDICHRVRSAGYYNMYIPQAKVIHLIGRSELNKEKIEEYFEESRYKYFKKYFGFVRGSLLELVLRVSKTRSLILLSILGVSIFMNFFRIHADMMFIGDMGRDYLAARDMILNRSIPLVGIPSSVVWLHQGPLSVYIIGISFLLSSFNPVAPAMAYALIGVLATFWMYKLGKLLFNTQVGFLSALFFATSPLVVINERMPYHTAAIPFFSIVFFYVMWLVLKGKEKLLPVLMFLLGILLQFELSNGVLVFMLLIVWFLFRPIFSKKVKVQAWGGFILGILPFILYDLTHRLTQTIGFPLWVINRIRLFFGLTQSGNSTTAHLFSALQTNFDQVSMMLFPASSWVVLILLLVVLMMLFRKRYEIKQLKSNSLSIVLLWVFTPLIGFSVHAAPGTAYFPLLFGGVILMTVYSVQKLISRWRFLMVFFVGLMVFNGMYTIHNNYFLNTYDGVHAMPPRGYNFGPNFEVREDVVKFIMNDSGGSSFRLEAGGFLSTMKTAVDNYSYLILLKGGMLSEESTTVYTIYEDFKDIKSQDALVYSNPYVWIMKNENN